MQPAGIASLIIHRFEEHVMIKRFAVIAVAAVGICVAMPAGAQEVGVGVGPGGVTVGTGYGDRERDRNRDVVRERDQRNRDETVGVRRGGDRGREMNRDRRPVVIDR